MFGYRHGNGSIHTCIAYIINIYSYRVVGKRIDSAHISYQYDPGSIPGMVSRKVRTSLARSRGFSLGTLVSSHTNDALVSSSEPTERDCFFIVVN